MPLDCLFFIADNGQGDLYGYKVVGNHMKCPDIFIWHHDDDSRIIVATSLRKFIEGRVNGSIT